MLADVLDFLDIFKYIVTGFQKFEFTHVRSFVWPRDNSGICMEHFVTYLNIFWGEVPEILRSILLNRYRYSILSLFNYPKSWRQYRLGAIVYCPYGSYVPDFRLQYRV